MRVDLNFEELDKLPIEKYRKLEESYLEFVQKLLIYSEEDYCKKKGLNKNNLTSEQHQKMRNAINQRKNLKIASQNLMMFNKPLRWMLGDIRK